MVAGARSPEDRHDTGAHCMANELSTSNRMFFLSPEGYGEDDLLVESMQGSEALSQLFHFTFRLLSARDDISPRTMIGSKAELRIETWDTQTMEGQRHWKGYISRFRRTGRVPSADGRDLYSYECDLVPWLWLMTRHQDIRIFQNMSIPDIFEKVLDDAGFPDEVKLDLHDEHPKLDYVTQYHETNFQFLSRLLEMAGIYWYHRHNERGDHGKHLLVLTDHVDGNPALAPPRYPFHHAGHAAEHDAVTRLESDFGMRTGRISMRDWDFKGRKVVPADTPTSIPIGGNEAWEHYHYPGGYVEAALGPHFTEVLMQAEEAAFLTLNGSSQIRQLVPGYTFELFDHLLDQYNRKYLIVTVNHHGQNNLMGGAASSYGNTFVVQPHDVPYRTPRRTPRPRVHGPQTAIVTGPPGEEIHVDEYGRIKVQFHWDRIGKYNDKSSCWMRVAQAWAGNGYGTMFIPRVGMEVVVDFLEGDPDQPIVTGCVYNGVNKVPYALPGEATKSTIKTLSSKGGGGTNELRFEDKKGKEEVFLQAQRKLNVLVKQNKYEQINADSHLIVGAASHYDFKSLHTSTYRGDVGIDITGQLLHRVRDGQHLRADLFHVLTDKEIHLESQGQYIGLKSPIGINLDSEMQITLRCAGGASGIAIGPAGVNIFGPMVKINSGGSATALGSARFYDYEENPAGVARTKDGTITDPLQQLQAQALRASARQGQAFCAECEAARAALEALAS